MIRKLVAALVLAAVLLVTGCASVPMASKDVDAKAKQFAPSRDGTANLYIYRNEIMGAAIKMPVLIDGMAAGDTVANGYIFRTLPAGSHIIVSKAENDSTLTIEMLAGQNYFVWQEIKMGVLYARSKLHQVDEATGEKGVKECSLIEGGGQGIAHAEPSATPAPTTIAIATPADAAPELATNIKPATPDASSSQVDAAEPARALAPAAANSVATAVATVPAAAEFAQSSIDVVAPVRESAANAAMEPIAQSVASGLGCGAVQANGATTFIATCGSYGVLIDCDSGQCRPMHTIRVKSDE